MAGDREFCYGLEVLRPLVGHEEDHFPVVLTPGVLLSQMRLGLLDQVVLVAPTYRFAARAIQVCLRHMFTIA